MIIEHRDDSLSYPKAIREEKVRLVLDWLLEFRFSSIDLLSSRLEQPKVNTNRFFNDLISSGLIQIFKNVHTKNERYVMLTTTGLSYLEAYGRDISKATTRVQHLGKYSKIIHDMSVQHSVLNRIHKYDEVIWDRHIDPDDFGSDRPDALLHSAKGHWVALEYERWRKDRKRIFMTYLAHVRAIEKKKYQAVLYDFNSEVDKNHYKDLFNADEWGIYKRLPNSTKIQKDPAGVFHPKEDTQLDLTKIFVFSVNEYS